jgi:hypothetical protein
MDKKPATPSPAEAPMSGQDARRRFLRTSGRAALAAPAAALLLSAASTNARAAIYTDLADAGPTRP